MQERLRTMVFAIDKDGKRIHIDKAYVNYDYFCPICAEKLVLRKGDVRRHHFAHHKSTNCTDSWHYDMSEWHQQWQEKFPPENQEVVFELNGKKHRADVFINNRVIEFQHSPLSPEEFDERNEFYSSLGYKVIWVFDLSQEFDESRIVEHESKPNLYIWKHPRRTFKNFDIKNKNIDLFFEIGTIEEDGILEPDLLKVTWATPEGFERFAVDGFSYNKNDLSGQKNDEDITGKREDIYDDMYVYHSIGTIGHGHIFYGCPLSDSGLATNNTIDRLDKTYKNCAECPHTFGYWKCRYAADYLKISNDVKIVEIKRNKIGIISSVTYESEGKIIEGILPKKDYKTMSIEDLWDDLGNPSIATFINLEKRFYVRINRNPREQYKKYGKVYGKFSTDQYSFSKNKESSKEVYNWHKPIWWCVWHEK